MLYEKFFDKLEKVRWNLGTDIQWDQIDPTRISQEQTNLIHHICKTEIGSLFAAESFIRDFYDDIDFSCYVSVWYYEEMKHCLVLKKYLSHLGIEIPEAEFQALRMSIPPSSKENILMIHFLSEHRLANWYRSMANWLDEPVGKDIFTLIADDEIRHGQTYFEFIQKDLERSPEHLYNYLRSAQFMLHPKAPSDIHAVTLTGTTDRLEDPRYITFIDEDLALPGGKDATNKRIYSLLSLLAHDKMQDYASLSAAVRRLKPGRNLQTA